MSKLIFKIVFLVGLGFYLTTSASIAEDWELYKGQSRPKIYAEIAQADREDNKFFSVLFGKKTESPEEAVSTILFNYPPKKRVCIVFIRKK